MVSPGNGERQKCQGCPGQCPRTSPLMPHACFLSLPLPRATRASPMPPSRATSPATTQRLPITALALPHPTSWPVAASPGQADATHRNLYCIHYGDCLHFAARQGWLDWGCGACALNVGGTPPSAVRWAEARIRLD